MFEDVNNGLEARNNEWLDALKQESAKKPKAYEELMEIKNRQKIDALNKQLDNDDMIVSMIGATDYGSGNFLDPAQIENVNKQRGTFGENGQPVNGQIRDAGYNENGDYQIDVWQKQQDGTMGVSSRVMPKKQVYGIMRHYADSGMFSQETIDGLRNSIQESDPSYTSSQFDALGSAYGQRRRMIEDQISRTMYGFGVGSSRGRGGKSLYGGTGKSDSVKSGKFNNDQVQYYINKQQQLMDEKSQLDPRKAEDAKRIAEIDEEILDAKAYERIAARQGLPVQGMNQVMNPSNPRSRGNAGIKAADVMAGNNPSKEGGRPSSFGRTGKDVKDTNVTKPESVEAQDKYTTKLDDNEEAAYQAWRDKLPKELQYEGDYDLRGFWKENGGKEFKSGDHMPDKFKKPNHKTFSVESKYATGEDASKAGRWDGDEFIPAKQNNEKNSSRKVSGRFKHEGHTSDFSKSLKASNDAAAKDEDLRRKRLEELRIKSNDERRKFMSNPSGKSFKFSEQEEADELMDPKNRAEDVINKYSAMRRKK